MSSERLDFGGALDFGAGFTVDDFAVDAVLVRVRVLICVFFRYRSSQRPLKLRWSRESQNKS
jgi:hypothetical protein